MIEKEERERLHEIFATFIKKKRMRQTRERFAILDEALDQHVHFDIDELYRKVEASFHVCRATVYNTVDLLCECNILRKHYLNETQAVYEYSGDRHLHLICLGCGAVREVHDNEVGRFVESRRFPSFTPHFSSTNIYGYCSKCSRKATKASRAESKADTKTNNLKSNN